MFSLLPYIFLYIQANLHISSNFCKCRPCQQRIDVAKCLASGGVWDFIGQSDMLSSSVDNQCFSLAGTAVSFNILSPNLCRDSAIQVLWYRHIHLSFASFERIRTPCQTASPSDNITISLSTSIVLLNLALNDAVAFPPSGPFC
jgi:hypothetical protein